MALLNTYNRNSFHIRRISLCICSYEQQILLKEVDHCHPSSCSQPLPRLPPWYCHNCNWQDSSFMKVAEAFQAFLFHWWILIQKVLLAQAEKCLICNLRISVHQLLLLIWRKLFWYFDYFVARSLRHFLWIICAHCNIV